MDRIILKPMIKVVNVKSSEGETYTLIWNPQTKECELVNHPSPEGWGKNVARGIASSEAEALEWAYRNLP